MIKSLQKIKPIYIFFIIYAVGAVFSIYFSSVYIFDIYKYLDEQKMLMNILCAAGILFNIFVYKTYNIKKFLLHLVITALILLSTSGYKSSMAFLWFLLLAARPVNFTKISKTVLAVTTAAIIPILIMTALGHGEIISFLRPGTNLIRYSYGFLNPTLFAAYLFQICMAHIYIRWKNWGSKDNIFTFSVLCLTFFFTNSRTSSLLLVILLLIMNIKKYLNKDFLTYFAESLLILCPALSVIMTKLYCIANPLGLLIDDFLSYRLRNSCYCFASFPIKFFGNHIKITHDMMLIKNFYINLLINYGVCLFFIFITAYAILIKKASKNNDMALISILILSLFQGITENLPAVYYLNFSILAFSALLNNYKLFEKD